MDKQIRENTGKPRFSLVPMWLLDGAANVFEYGATKYETWNWTKGDNILKLLDSAYRHIIAFQAGVDDDDETGESHIDHAIANLLFIKHTMAHHPSYDDRIGRGVAVQLVLPEVEAPVSPPSLTEQIPEDLRNFLLKEKALVAYKNNYENYSDDGMDEPKDISSMVSAFAWAFTPEGLDFWMRLNNKFNG